MRARLRSSVCLPMDSVALDALLAAAVCVRDQIPPAIDDASIVPIEVPLAREPGGRFHLASVGHFEIEAHELRHVQKRPAVEYFKSHGSPKIGTVSISSGPDKGARIPTPVLHPRDGLITWWAVGDEPEVRELLGLVSHLGKRRAVGVGHVDRWDVETTEPWGHGFPLLLPGGAPTRSLPEDWPDVAADTPRGWRCITYPYWRRSEEQPCYLASAMG